MKHPLISTDSPLYLKRLTRELNSLGDGFYSNGIRYSAARIRAGQIQGYRLAAYLDPQDPRAESHNPWKNIDTQSPLSDAYGRTVSASRSP